MQKKWEIKKAGDAAITKQLSAELNIGAKLAGMLVQRGISTFEEAKIFFRPSKTDLHDPFLMKDMEKAVERILSALEQGEKILVYGDYDVDGTSSVALVYSFLKSLNHSPNVSFYIPDRYREGYGISFAGIDWAQENGCSLIIALDCGIKSIDKVEYANQKKIDFIICDHHLPGDTLPDAVAVLDPKRSDCPYPYKELSGCGIGLKMVQALTMKMGLSEDILEEYFDLAAISIGADIVPITGENRALTFFGLKRINSHPRAGIKAMLELANVKNEVNVSDLVFIIGPRINAAGRLEDAKRSVELLIADDQGLAKTGGLGLHNLNQERKELDANITEEALELIRTENGNGSRKSTVVFNPNWHKGVIGIVASRLTEHYYRPTIVFTKSGEMATGSARSVKDFDIYTAIESCSGLLEQYGGHKFAAGITLKAENMDAFKQKFEEVVSASITEEMLQPKIEIDDELFLNEINFSFFNIIKQFAPFGPGNMKPVFISRNLVDSGYSKIVGDNHLRLSVVQKNPSSGIFNAIAFGFGDFYKEIAAKKPFEMCYTIEENKWNDTVSLQLSVKDIRIQS